MFFEKATKKKQNSVHVVGEHKRQIDGEDFVIFCGLLRKHELVFVDS